MNEWKMMHVPFNAPICDGDTEETTKGCRANNPNICKNNGIAGVCAFVSEDRICKSPSKAWKKQFIKLCMEAGSDSK